MADEGTAKTLVSIGAWIALIILLIMFGVIGFFGFISLPFIGDFFIWLLVFGVLLIALVVSQIFTIIFMALWFSWRHDPSAHKTGLIVTGILGLFLAYGLPGLLVLIGGAIAPSEMA
jgi:hypothetical protein